MRGRGNMRGPMRGLPHHRMQRGGGMQQNRVFVPHIPFDVVLCENQFPRVKSDEQPCEEKWNEFLVRRNEEVSAGDEAKLSAMVAEVIEVLQGLKECPPADFDLVIEDVKQVGGLKKGTTMKGNKTGSIAVMLKSLPAKEIVPKFAEKVKEDLEGFELTVSAGGFTLVKDELSVEILIGTVGGNLRFLKKDVHIEGNYLHSAICAIRHAKWFQQNASHQNVVAMVRIIKDLSNRFQGFSPLTTWIIDLLAHHCVMRNPANQPLSLFQAFKRFLRLLAAGFFLPGSAGIVDPCENGHVRVHTFLSLEQQDQICFTAQTLLRIVSHGGFEKVYEYGSEEKLVSEVTYVGNIVVTPSEKAYDKVSQEENESYAKQENMDTN